VEYKLPKEYEDKKEVLISNYSSIKQGRLRPYEALMYRV